MIATVKLVRPDELLSLIREAADLPGPSWFSADAARERHMSAFGTKRTSAAVQCNVRFRGKSRHRPRSLIEKEPGREVSSRPGRSCHDHFCAGRDGGEAL